MRARLDVSGFNEAIAAASQLAGDLPGIVLADAINHTAYQARQALHRTMAEVFDRPTPWTLRSVQVFQAKPKKLEAALWINDYRASKDLAPDRWLKAQVFGGPREDKAMERALRAKGILPPGKFIVPTQHTRVDAYGNISSGLAMQILSGLGAAEVYSGRTANASHSRRSLKKGHAKAFFVIRRGKVPIGIAERRGKGMVVVLAFGRQPTYAPRLKFHEIIADTAELNLASNVDQAITKALSK